MKSDSEDKFDEYFDNTDGLILFESLSDDLDKRSKETIECIEKESLKECKVNFTSNIFSDLFKYKASDLSKPKENFTTESFVFLLRLSVDSDRVFLNYFLSLIDKNIQAKEDDIIHVETQKRCFSVINSVKIIAIPDITIIINSLYIFIEIKVESILNEDELTDGDKKYTINQLEKYNNIVLKPNNTNRKIICSLTIIKEKTKLSFEYIPITWSQISSLIDKYPCLDLTFKRLLEEFSQFIKSENMAIQKVENIINDGVKNLISLLHQIKIALTDLNFKPSLTSGETYSGYYIEIIDPGIKLWIGFEYKHHSIKIQLMNKELISYILEEKKYIIDTNSKKYVLVSDLLTERSDYFDLPSDEQFGVMSNWLRESISRLLEITKTANRQFKINF